MILPYHTRIPVKELAWVAIFVDKLQLYQTFVWNTSMEQSFSSHHPPALFYKLSSYLSLGLANDSVRQVFPPKLVCEFVFSHVCRIAYFVIWSPPYNLANSTKIVKPLVTPFSAAPVTSSLLDPYILLSTRFSNEFGRHFSQSSLKS
jgi:hypothetical protein